MVLPSDYLATCRDPTF